MSSHIPEFIVVNYILKIAAISICCIQNPSAVRSVNRTRWYAPVLKGLSCWYFKTQSFSWCKNYEILAHYRIPYRHDTRIFPDNSILFIAPPLPPRYQRQVKAQHYDDPVVYGEKFDHIFPLCIVECTVHHPIVSSPVLCRIPVYIQETKSGLCIRRRESPNSEHNHVMAE